MAGVSLYQMIELMPRDQWNLKPSKSEYGRFREDEDVGKSPEEIVRAQLRRLIIEDEANKAQTSRRHMEQKAAGTGMFPMEHTAVDEADLTIYRPFAMRSDALLNAVMTAFDRHHPIVFTPDLVYAYLATGVATHINKFSEQLRKLYVSFDGKQELKYRNDSFRQGKKENDWADMFKNFADQLNEKTKENSVVQNGLSFSTSSQMTEAHRHVLAMEGMKSYYDYKCYTRCGMSCIILEGTAEDWRLVQKTVMAQLNEINDFCDKNGEAKEAMLKWWSPTVEVMLDQFVTTYETRARGEDLPANLATWWRTIYKYNAARGSGGGATATGWINIFYPYLTKEKQNPWVTHMASFITDAETFADILNSFFIGPEENVFGRGRKHPPAEVELEDYPSYVASVPFTWVYFGTKYKMNTLIGYSVGAQVAVEGKQYPVGTIKLFPAWTIYYRE